MYDPIRASLFGLKVFMVYVGKSRVWELASQMHVPSGQLKPDVQIPAEEKF